MTRNRLGTVLFLWWGVIFTANDGSAADPPSQSNRPYLSQPPGNLDEFFEDELSDEELDPGTLLDEGPDPEVLSKEGPDSEESAKEGPDFDELLGEEEGLALPECEQPPPTDDGIGALLEKGVKLSYDQIGRRIRRAQHLDWLKDENGCETRSRTWFDFEGKKFLTGWVSNGAQGVTRFVCKLDPPADGHCLQLDLGGGAPEPIRSFSNRYIYFGGYDYSTERSDRLVDVRLLDLIDLGVSTSGGGAEAGRMSFDRSDREMVLAAHDGSLLRYSDSGEGKWARTGKFWLPGLKLSPRANEGEEPRRLRLLDRSHVVVLRTNGSFALFELWTTDARLIWSRPEAGVGVTVDLFASPDGKVLMVVGENGGRLFDTTTGAPVSAVFAPDNFRPRDTILAELEGKSHRAGLDLDGTARVEDDQGRVFKRERN